MSYHEDWFLLVFLLVWTVWMSVQALEARTKPHRAREKAKNLIASFPKWWPLLRAVEDQVSSSNWLRQRRILSLIGAFLGLVSLIIFAFSR
jgi:hypothetical protein